MEDSDHHSIEDIELLRMRLASLERARAQAERAQRLVEQSHETERRFSEQLSALLEIAIELADCETTDELCRKAVELGRDRLGFDRIGIWFRTSDPEVIAGSYGVDYSGQIVDERTKRTRLNADSPDGRIVLSKEPFAQVGEAPVLDSFGEPVGRATQLFAALWDGRQVIGHISADNQVHYEPLASRQCELLRLFGLTLGYLYSHKQIEIEREKLIAELREALARIKTLHGLIPICAACKKVRDDEGYWKMLEVYVQEHSEADFSHSICPECTRKLYPDLVNDKQAKKESGG